MTKIISQMDIKQLKIKKGDSITPNGIYGNKIHFIIDKNKKEAHRSFGIMQNVDNLTMEMFGISEVEFLKWN